MAKDLTPALPVGAPLMSGETDVMTLLRHAERAWSSGRTVAAEVLLEEVFWLLENRDGTGRGLRQ